MSRSCWFLCLLVSGVALWQVCRGSPNGPTSSLAAAGSSGSAGVGTLGSAGVGPLGSAGVGPLGGGSESSYGSGSSIFCRRHAATAATACSYHNVVIDFSKVPNESPSDLGYREATCNVDNNKQATNHKQLNKICSMPTNHKPQATQRDLLMPPPPPQATVSGDHRSFASGFLTAACGGGGGRGRAGLMDTPLPPGTEPPWNNTHRLRGGGCRISCYPNGTTSLTTVFRWVIKHFDHFNRTIVILSLFFSMSAQTGLSLQGGPLPDCDVIEETPAFFMSHDLIFNLGHTISDFWIVFATMKAFEVRCMMSVRTSVLLLPSRMFLSHLLNPYTPALITRDHPLNPIA